MSSALAHIALSAQMMLSRCLYPSGVSSEAGLAFLKRPIPAADLMIDEDPELYVCRAIEAAVLKKNGITT